MKNTIQLSVTTRLVPTRFDVVQYATAPEIELYITDWTPTGTARIYIEKPSGAKVYNNCTIEGQSVLFTPTTQAFAEVGENKCQLEIMDGETVVLSFLMFANVVENIIDSSAIESTDEFTALQDALQEIQDVDTRIATAKTEAIETSNDYTRDQILLTRQYIKTQEIDPLATRVATNEGNIATNQTDIANLQATVGSLGSDGTYNGGGLDDGVTTVPSGAWTVIGSITPPEGQCIIVIIVRFNSNATGYRQVMLSRNNTADSSGGLAVWAQDTAPAINGTYAYTRIIGGYNFGAVESDPQTYYVKAYQTSGANLTIAPRVIVYKIRENEGGTNGE